MAAAPCDSDLVLMPKLMTTNGWDANSNAKVEPDQVIPQ